jgi:hypothetical protein
VRAFVIIGSGGLAGTIDLYASGAVDPRARRRNRR